MNRFLAVFIVVFAAAGLPSTAPAAEPAIPGVTITPDVVYGHKDGMAAHLRRLPSGKCWR